jgi:hypothetical protein
MLSSSIPVLSYEGRGPVARVSITLAALPLRCWHQCPPTKSGRKAAQASTTDAALPLRCWRGIRSWIESVDENGVRETAADRRDAGEIRVVLERADVARAIVAVIAAIVVEHEWRRNALIDE